MDSTPSSLDQDEPETPTWFTLLGIAIFLFGGIFALVSAQGEPEEAAALSADSPSALPADAEAEPEADPTDPHAGHDHE